MIPGHYLLCNRIPDSRYPCKARFGRHGVTPCKKLKEHAPVSKFKISDAENRFICATCQCSSRKWHLAARRAFPFLWYYWFPGYRSATITSCINRVCDGIQIYSAIRTKSFFQQMKRGWGGQLISMNSTIVTVGRKVTTRKNDQSAPCTHCSLNKHSPCYFVFHSRLLFQHAG